MNYKFILHDKNNVVCYQQSTTHPMFQAPLNVKVAHEPSLVLHVALGFFNLSVVVNVSHRISINL